MANHANSTTVPAIRTVDFHGDKIATFEHSGGHFVAMRRIVENLGMDWARQSVKLVGHMEKFNCCHMPTVGADGKDRDMLSMPVEKLPLWLATINPNKVAATVRPKLERYQAESAIALHEYWTKGMAVRGDLEGVVTELDPNVARVIGGIVKGVVAKAIAQTVPAMVEAALASDPRRAVLDYVSVRQLLNDAGAEQKGRNRVNRKIGYELRTCALIRQPPAELRRCPHSGVWLYPRSFTNAYMASRGASLVGEHNATMRGQGVLKLVAKTSPQSDRSV